jgi:hypothetical protein
VPPANRAFFCFNAAGSYVNGVCTIVPEDPPCPAGTRDATGTTCHHTHMEVEWENASVMHVNRKS